MCFCPLTTWAIARYLWGMTKTDALLTRIKQHCLTRGIAETTFGRIAVNDGKLVPRLRAGRSITLATLERVETFIADQQVADQSSSAG